jgi:hypothetical protein
MRMRSIFAIFTVTSTLVSCTTNDFGVVDSIQDRTAALCRFIPTAQTISSLISLDYGSVVAIADAICKAVTEPSGTEAGPTQREISGIPIEGHFIQRQ